MSERLSKMLKKWHFFNFQVKAVTLTFSQGHPMSHHFKFLPPGYLWAMSHNSTLNSVWDIVKNVKKCLFSKFLVNTVTLTEGHPRSYHFEGLPTGAPLANFHNFVENSVRDIANVKVCHRRMDGQTTEGHYIDSLCLHTWTKTPLKWNNNQLSVDLSWGSMS